MGGALKRSLAGWNPIRDILSNGKTRALRDRIKELEDELAGERQRADSLAGSLASLERDISQAAFEASRKDHLIDLLEGKVSNVTLAALRSEFGNKDAVRIARSLYDVVFVDALKQGCSLSEAAVKTTRTQMAWGDAPFPMPIVLSLLANPSTMSAGYLAFGVLLARRNLLPSALDAFLRADRDELRKLAYPEFISALASKCPDEVTMERDFLANMMVEEENPGYLHSLIRALYGNGLKDSALVLADRIRQAPERKKILVGPLKNQIEWFSAYEKFVLEKIAWHDAAAASGAPIVALLDYKQPDVSFTSINIGDYIQTLAMLGCILRLSNIDIEGHSTLTAAISSLQSRVRQDRIATGQKAKIALTVLDRDATYDAPPPPGTWLLAFGWHMHKSFSGRLAFPYHPNVRPIFLSFHCNKPEMLNDEGIEYLRRYSPIGCRDWTTVYLLQSRGVPAFFSGCVTTTIDTLFAPRETGSQSGQTAFIDAPSLADEQGNCSRKITHGKAEYRWTDFSTNLRQAVDLLEEYRTQYDRIVTSRLHAYLPCAAMGLPVEFRPNRQSDIRFEGLLDLDHEMIESIRNPLLEKTAAILNLIATGVDADQVYSAWSDMCREDVDEAKGRCANIPDIRLSADDVKALVAEPLSGRVSYGEFSPDVDPASIVHVALAADRGYASYLCVVLQSILRNSERPVQFHILSRGLEEKHYNLIGERLSSSKCCVQFLPFDSIDYGNIVGMYARTTFSTMDRLLLPYILPDVRKIAYIDIDVVVLGDVGTLYDIDLGGMPLAARGSIAPEASGGFSYVIPASIRLAPNFANEFRRRMALRSDLAFPTFNAGVLVLDLEQMRKIRFCEEFLPYVTRYGLNDQELLNCFAAGNWCPLPKDWNAWPTQEILNQPKLVHFVGINKPWNGHNLPFANIWRAYRNEVEDLASALQ